MAKNYILAFDQGTTSSRSILFDASGHIVASAQREFEQIYPRPGWVEHDPMAIWDTQLATAREVLRKSGAGAGEIAAIGITNQRETTVVWDRKTGEPIHNAIVWQCRRTTEMCERLKAEGMDQEVRERTGLLVDAYFSGTKVAWILDQVPGSRERAARGELCFGTIDSWLLYKLTGAHATDHTNACRTMLLNIHDLAWDEVIVDKLDIPDAMLPEIKPTSGVFESTTLFGGEIPVACLVGDQQGALFGQAAFQDRSCKNTYGTGCFLVMNIGEQPVPSKHGLLTTVGWTTADERRYAMEGSIFVTGAVIQWLRDELRLISSAAESERLAAEVPDSGGVCLVPAFVGLGAPHWDMRARGIITGLTRGANRAHIVRAALESISFQSAEVVRTMEQDTGERIPRLKVDGGACANNLLMQHQADLLGVPVVRPKMIETTALGAAYHAGLAVGFWSSRDELADRWEEDRVFEPEWSEDRRAGEMARWADAVRRARSD
jgi:glycerol kinase